MAIYVHEVRNRPAQTGLDPRPHQVPLIVTEVQTAEGSHPVHGFLLRSGFYQT
jgi:hypothetical protein